MKHAFLLTGFLAVSALADAKMEKDDKAKNQNFKPITSFNEGMYLGLGQHFTQDGQSHYYASYAVFFSNMWELIYLNHRGTRAYNMQFDIDDLGFLQIEVRPRAQDNANATQQAGHEDIYLGHGWCGSRQCQYTIDIGQDRINETITFHPGGRKISRVGNVHLTSDAGQTHVIVWEEHLSRIDSAAKTINN